MNTPLSRALVAACLLFALAVRGAVLWRGAGELARDPDDYRHVAENLAATGVLGHGDTPTAYRSPLYPILLAAIGTLRPLDAWSIGGLHLVLGVTTVWLTIRIGVLWQLGRWSLLAGLLAAADPILLGQSTIVMTETMATFLAAAALWLLSLVINNVASKATADSLLDKPAVAPPKLSEPHTDALALLAGGTLAAAALCRPTFLPWAMVVPLTVPWILRHLRQATSKSHTASSSQLAAWRLAAIIYLGLLAGYAPWAIRNAVSLGSPIIATTHGGYTLLLANNAQFYEHIATQPNRPWDASEFNSRVMAARQAAGPEASEVAIDRREYAEAIESIRAKPAGFFRASLYRMRRLWALLPMPLAADDAARGAAARYAVAAWYAVVSLLAIAGLWSLGRLVFVSQWLWAMLLAADFTLVHAFYWTDMRMRAPLVVCVSLTAAAGARCLTMLRTRPNSESPMA